MSTKLWVGFLFGISLCVVSRPAVAQGSGFPNLGNIGPSKAEVVGAIVGAAAVIGLVVYLVLPKQKTIEGCVESADGMSRLTNEKDHQRYVLTGDSFAFRSGQRMRLKGKKSKDKSGALQFRAKKVVKDEGACGSSHLSGRQDSEANDIADGSGRSKIAGRQTAVKTTPGESWIPK